MFDLLKWEIVSRRNAIAGWGLGLVLFAAMYLGIYPEMVDQIQLMDLSDISFYQAMGVEMGTFEAYVGSSVIQFAAIILAIYALLSGTGALAGEEDAGTLELLVVAPIPRWQIVAMKALALAVVLLAILLIAGAGSVATFNAIETQVETDVTGGDIFVAVLSIWPIVFTFAMISLFLGATLPTRRAAALTVTVLFIASYFGKGLLGMVDSLESLRPLSLHYYFDTSSALLREGVRPGDAGVLLAVSVLFLGLAVLSFQRRDVTTGAWPWQRAAARDAQV